MSYRDESDGLRARVEELEAELAGARAEIAALKGEKRSSSASVKPARLTSLIVGAPAIMTFERVVDREPDDEALGRMAYIVPDRLGVHGVVNAIGRNVRYRLRGPIGAVQFNASTADGRTELRLDVNHRAVAVQLFTISFLIAHFVGMLLFVRFDSFHFFVGALAGWLPLFLLMRFLASKWIARYQRQCEGTLEAISALLREQKQPMHARVIAAPKPVAEPDVVEEDAEDAAVLEPKRRRA